MNRAIDAQRLLGAERASRDLGDSGQCGFPGSSRGLAVTMHKRLRLSCVAVGLGAWLWGWCIPGDADGMYPEHTTGRGHAEHRVDGALSRPLVGLPWHTTEAASVTVALAEAHDEGGPTETAPVMGVDTQHDVMERPTRPMQPARQAPAFEMSRSPGVATLDLPLSHMESSLATKTSSSVVEDVPVQKPQAAPAVPSSADAPFVPNATVEAVGQRAPIIRPRPRHVTPREASLAHARDLIAQRRYAQAVTVLAPLFVTPPQAWEPWFWLGTAQLGLGQWADARESLLGGLARDAAMPQLWVHHALVSQQQGRPGEALESLRQAELLAPQLPEVQLNLAYALEVQGAAPVAVEHYRLFLALTKDNHAYNGTREKVRRHLMRFVTR